MTQYDIQIEDLPESLQDIAKRIGLPATLEIVKICGGQSPYIPKMSTCELEAKHRVIYDTYLKSRSGRIYSELALEYDYSESYIREIIRKKERNKAEKIGCRYVQQELF